MYFTDILDLSAYNEEDVNAFNLYTRIALAMTIF